MTLLTKAEFARHPRVKRSPGRVSQWLSEGRIRGDAIEHTAEGDRINLEIALTQLGIGLDVSQQAAQVEPILPLAGAPGAEPSDDDEAAPLAAAPGNSDQLRLLRAKADGAVIKAEQDRIALMAENGQWVRASTVTATWQRNLGDLLALIEANLPQMADEVAAELGLDAKAMTIAMRRHFRALRQRLADEAAGRAGTSPAPTATADDLVAA